MTRAVVAVRRALEWCLEHCRRALAKDVTADLPEGSAVVFAPHPDDETLGCGGVLALKARKGHRPHVVVMTDGTASHSDRMSAIELAARRKQECLRAVGRLGVRPDDCSFLGFPDAELRHHKEAAVETVARLIEQQSPRHVFVPSRRDGLPDHVATFEIVSHALKRVGKPVEVFEYPVWLWQTWPWSASEPAIPRTFRELAVAVRNTVELVVGCRIRVDVRAVRELKLKALGEHRSQMQRPQDDEAWPVLADVDSGRFLARLTRDEETFRRTVFRA